MTLLIDNYDSFSYNLVQMLGVTDPNIRVVRNDKVTVEEVRDMQPDHIVISPGPGRPKDAGISMEVIRQMKDEVPILGVCLGHQAICAVFGMTITYARKLMHGKQSEVTLDRNCALFKGLPETIAVARYHSLAADIETLPEDLIVTAKTRDDEIMGIAHRTYPVYGVQFHPESILTEQGATILNNFLEVRHD